MLEVQSSWRPQPPSPNAYFDFGRMMWVFNVEQGKGAGTSTEVEPPVKVEQPQASPPRAPVPKRERCALPIVNPDTGDELVVEKKEFKPSAPSVKVPSSPAVMVAPSPMLQSTFPGLFPPMPPLTLNMGYPPMSTHYMEDDESPPEDFAELDSPPARGRGKGKGKGKGANRKGKGGGGGRGGGRRNKRHVDGRLYTPGNYTASMDGKFWCLSQWPTGERDEEHRCRFGQHCLEVDNDGIIRPILVGGVGDYRVTVHLNPVDPQAEPDFDGWIVATCGPDMVDLMLTDQAKRLGWTIEAGPTIVPPQSMPHMLEEDANEEAKGE